MLSGAGRGGGRGVGEGKPVLTGKDKIDLQD